MTVSKNNTVPMTPSPAARVRTLRVHTLPGPATVPSAALATSSDTSTAPSPASALGALPSPSRANLEETLPTPAASTFSGATSPGGLVASKGTHPHASARGALPSPSRANLEETLPTSPTDTCDVATDPLRANLEGTLPTPAASTFSGATSPGGLVATEGTLPTPAASALTGATSPGGLVATEGTLPTPAASALTGATTNPTGSGSLENIFQNMAPARIWSPHAVVGAQSNGANFAAYRGEHVASKSVKAPDEQGSGDRVVVHDTSEFAARIERASREEAASSVDMSRVLPTVSIRPGGRWFGAVRARQIVLAAALGGALALTLVLFGAVRARSESGAQGDSVHAASSLGDTPSATTSPSPTFGGAEASASAAAYREADSRVGEASSDEAPLAGAAAHRLRGALDGHGRSLSRSAAPNGVLSASPRAVLGEPAAGEAPRGTKSAAPASVQAKEGFPVSREGTSPTPPASNSSSSSSTKFFPEERY